MSRIKIYPGGLLDRLPRFPDAYGLRGGGDLDALFPTRVLQVVNGAGIGNSTTDPSLSGVGSTAAPLSVVGAPYATVPNAPYPVAGALLYAPVGGSTSFNISATDALAQPGDLLYLWTLYQNTGAINTPTGFNVLDAQFNPIASNYVKTFTRVMQAGDTTFTVSATSGNVWMANLIPIRKAGGSPTVDQNRSDSGGDTNPLAHGAVHLQNTLTMTKSPGLFMAVVALPNPGNGAVLMVPRVTLGVAGATPRTPVSDPFGPNVGFGPAVAFIPYSSLPAGGISWQMIFPYASSAANTNYAPACALANFY